MNYFTSVVDEASFGSTTDEFAVGNRVFVYVNKERAKELQQNHGGWNDAMEEVAMCNVV